ncbi:MAG: M67 family metallopeptidase [Spirochaetota bacterium]
MPDMPNLENLWIIPGVKKQMMEHARQEAPLEACGLLAGKGSRVERLYRMKNADRSSEHYSMQPEEQFKVVKDIRNAGLHMLGIYHSHPHSPPRPSAEDIKMALTPGVAYVIVSLMRPEDPEVRGYLIDEGTVREIPVRIGEPDAPRQTNAGPVEKQ